MRRPLGIARIDDCARTASRRPATSARRQVGTPRCALLFALLLFAIPVQASDVEPAPNIDEGIEEAEPESVLEAEEADRAEDVNKSVDYVSTKALFDLAIVRPLLARLVAGCVLSGPVALLSLPGGVENVKDMIDIFVYQPYWDTFEEPLGKF